jgi:nucleoside-diphosphate-sugar epimerase
MKFIITGGLGYIGSELSLKLLKKGHSVLIIDSLIYEQSISKFNQIFDEYKLNLIIKYIDVRNYDLIEESIKQFKPDSFIHFGDLSSVYSCNHNPVLTEDVCFNATKKIASLCSDLDIPILYNSSSSVYGTQTERVECNENTFLPITTDLYCKYKLKNESYFKEIALKNNFFKFIIFRPATLFGISSRFRIELLPNHFSYLAVSKNIIKVSDLNAYRAFISINTITNIYLDILENNIFDNEIYNIGSYNLTKLEVAIDIQKLTDCKIVTMDDIGDLRNLQISCNKYINKYGSLPSVNFLDEIGNVIEWLKVNYNEIESNNYNEMLNMPLANWKKLI